MGHSIRYILGGHIYGGDIYTGKTYIQRTHIRKDIHISTRYTYGYGGSYTRRGMEKIYTRRDTHIEGHTYGKIGTRTDIHTGYSRRHIWRGYIYGKDIRTEGTYIQRTHIRKDIYTDGYTYR